MTAMERIGDCGNGYDPPCPPGIENDFYLMGGAAMAIAIGSIMTWGVGLVVAIVTAGITALVYSQTVPANLQSGEFITAGVCFGLLAVGIAIGSAAVRGGAAKRKAIEEQIAEEARFKQRATMAMGTVTALRDTGTTINDNPEAAITVTYTRADGIRPRWKRLKWCRGWRSRGAVTRQPSGTTRPPVRQSRSSAARNHPARTKFPDTHYPR